MAGGVDVAALYQAAMGRVQREGSGAAWYGLGVALEGLGRWGAAAGAYGRCVGLDEADWRGWVNLGWCRHLTGRSDGAVEAFERAIGLAPEEGKPWALMSQALLTMGRFEEAYVAAGRGVELEGEAINRVALAFAAAATGRWGEAWETYEHRFDYKLPQFRARPYRLWRGEEVGHLYLEAEQGLGDTIFALRWLEAASLQAGRVTLFVQGPLYSLVREGVPANVDVRPMPAPLPGDADAWCPLLSLPVALGVGEPWWGGPWLRPVERSAAVYFGEARQVGVAWMGNPAHDQAHHRDCGLAYWLPLLERSDVVLHALQVGAGAEQQQELMTYGLMRDRGPELTNMADTAAVVAGLDLVISVDTSVAHLAGAMGKPCWLLANWRGTDFRWRRGEETTGWYPGHRIFWRGLGEDWGVVMGRVAEALG